MTTLTLDYINDPRVYAAQQEFFNGASWVTWKRPEYGRAIKLVAILVLASLAAAKAELFFALALFVVLLVMAVVKVATLSRTFKGMLAATVDRPAKHISLVADDSGLHETVDGIQSFAPWTSVVGFSFLKDALFIELKAGLWAMIPCYGLGERSASAVELVELMRHNGVMERGERNAGVAPA